MSKWKLTGYAFQYYRIATILAATPTVTEFVLSGYGHGGSATDLS